MKRVNISSFLLIAFLTLCLGQTVFASFDGNFGSAGSPSIKILKARQDILAQAENLIQQGKQQGLDYLNSKDDKTKKSCKKNLEDAEKLLKKELKQAASCEKCFELLTLTYFYQTYFGFSKDYDDALKTADEGLKQFPANGRLVYYKGSAFYNSGQFSESIRTFKALVMNPTLDAQTVAQVKQIIQDSQTRFLLYWNRHANYYQSPESKIMAYNPQTYRQEPIFQVTPDWELNLGSQGFTALTSTAAKVEDAELKSYLEDLVSRLVGKSPGSPFDYKLTIVNSPEINAVTPPGHIIIYTGLLNFAENESELAGVLAHELAHNYAHHQARAVLQKYQTQNLTNALIQLVSPQNQIAQIAAQIGGMITVELFTRAYSRFEEKEADLYGSHILFNAGYNPTAMSTVFLKLYKMNPKQPIKFLSTHPPASDRAAYMTDYLECFPLEKEMQLDSKAFQQMKAKLATIVPAAGQKQPGKPILPDQKP